MLDMIMPEMDGKETFHALRNIRPEVKVLLSSGYSPNDGIQDVIDEGIVGVLHKPYTKALLEAAILQAMGK